MSLLKVDNMSHSFGDNVLLQGISFDLYEKEKLGLVGRNGSGKSTLLKIITGEIIHEEGEVSWRPKINIGYLDQYREIDPGLSIGQYLQTAYAHLYALERQYEKLNKELEATPDMKRIEQAAKFVQQLVDSGFYELDSHINRVATGLGVSALGMNSIVANLSGGQRAKVILAKLLLENPDVLIMDEPTNFLDASHIEWLSDYLRNFDGAFIVVSHHFDFLDGISNSICEIEFQSVRKYKGNLRAYLTAKDMHRQQYLKNYNAQRKFIEKTEDYISRNKARASTARQAQSRAKMLAKVKRLPPPKNNPEPHFNFPCAALANGLILEAVGLEIGYDRPLLSDISFKLEWGDKLAITGFNGIGKTTLIKTLLGEQTAMRGEYRFHAGALIGYFHQEYAWGDDSLTPFSYIAGLFPRLDRKEIFSALAQSGISGEHFTQSLSSLSGGEQAKVRLCQLSLNSYNLLVFDEPTNHLDIRAKELLRASLREYMGSLIIISHDKSFCEGLVDYVLDVEKLLSYTIST